MILQKELVSKHSSTWVGIQYLLLTGSIIFGASLTLQFLGIAYGVDLFGFFYITEWQFFRLLLISIFIGTSISSFLLRNKIAHAYNPKKSIYVSSVFLSLPFILLACGAILDTFSDKSSLKDAIIHILLSLVLAIEHFALSRVFLRKFFAENIIPTSTSTQSITADQSVTTEAPLTQTIMWEISATERRNQIKTFISQAGFLFIAFVCILPFILPTGTHPSEQYDSQFLLELMYAVVGAVVSLTIFYFINKIFPYKNRAYKIDETGITISKGTKTKYFAWSDFACFYEYSKLQKQYPSGSKAGEIQRSMTDVQDEIEGVILYLQKKSGVVFDFGKVFVVIRTKPENQTEVIEVLRKKLTEREMTTTTDIGLVLYECK